jgi:hypothetical protein
MENSFQTLQAHREAMLPPDLEHRLIQQIGTFSVFGKVVELFVPNALNTCARFIDGDCNGGFGGPEPEDDLPEWRSPQRGGAGPGADELR